MARPIAYRTLSRREENRALVASARSGARKAEAPAPSLILLSLIGASVGASLSLFI